MATEDIKVAEVSELDKFIQTGDIAGLNAHIAEEAKKKGIDPTKAPAKVAEPVTTSEAEAVAKEEPVVPAAEEPITYQLSVELAPGHSIVVESDTEEGCRLKADLAQKAANVAIGAKPKDAPVVPASTLTADESFALGTKLQAGHLEAIDEYLEKNPDALTKALSKKGINLEELQQSLSERRSAGQVNEGRTVTDAFKEEHPEYVPTDKNLYLMGNKIIELAQARGERSPAVPTVDQLSEAYADLNTKGWLDTKAPEGSPVPVAAHTRKAPSSSMIGLSGGGADVRPKGATTVDTQPPRELLERGTPAQLAAWYNSVQEQATGRKAPLS